MGRQRVGLRAVAGVDLDILRGETLGLVGESGCGKSTLARCVVRLLPLSSGQLLFDGQDITQATPAELKPIRRRMQMVFQDPYGSLNPRRRVGSIIAEPFRIHGVASGRELQRRVHELMELVGLNPEHYNRFPADFSGGQRQRIGIARALALRPDFIVCDEPVSALDVSIQAQVLNLLADLQRELSLTYLFISHDLSVVRHVSDRVAVMYLGRIVELAAADQLYGGARHPYTQALLAATPELDADPLAEDDPEVLQGEPPSPHDPPSGCHFHPRCPRCQARCTLEQPMLAPAPDGTAGHEVACHFPISHAELRS
jgi:peptide/nickel transport system ATP-binding protein/oligopeptide transport system ATP-binding protein